MKEFTQAHNDVQESDAYKTFAKKNPRYYLVHGFLQLDATFTPNTSWQIGFYAQEQDNIAVFETNPVTLKAVEEAFKDGGIIDELILPVAPTSQAIKIIRKLLKKEYPSEQPTSIILIVQTINNQAVYNITVITKTFSMIITRIDAKTGEIISHNKRSVLDLKKE